MIAIVSEFGKFWLNWIFIGMSTSGSIFLYKKDKIIGDIEGIKAYFDSILVLIKDNLPKHIEEL